MRAGGGRQSRYGKAMGYGVFIHRTDSIYDDSPAERYQFPRQYLGRVRACVGDWIVYYEPRKVRETRGYHAMARVQQVVDDPTAAGMFIAIIEPGTFMPFANPVPFAPDGNLVERGVLNEHGAISGRAQSAVRPLSPGDFARILARAFDDEQPVLPRIGDAQPSVGFDDQPQQPFIFDDVRARVGTLTSRLARDRVFRKIVLQAYDRRCAITGLRLINGGGRAEVDAAHIKPVDHNGPDDLRNGIALSGTAHWMFDRGLIALADDLTILVSRQVNDPDSVRTIINRTGRAHAPERPLDRPHPAFLHWHREHCFKQ
jgi:putative restriction endonuclease